VSRRANQQANIPLLKCDGCPVGAFKKGNIRLILSYNKPLAQKKAGITSNKRKA